MMSTIPWRSGVNMREFAYYTRPELIEFAKTDGQRLHLIILQDAQLNELKQMKVKLVRFFASHKALSFAENISQVRAALDAIDCAGMQAVVCLADSLASGFFIPGDEEFHNQELGHLDKRYWLEQCYHRNYLRYLDEITAALGSHPAAALWELGNEYAIHPRAATAADVDAFCEFVREASAAIKRNAPAGLVSVGLINSNQIVQDGSDQQRLDFARRLYGLNHVDVVSLHVYAENREDPWAMIDVQAAKSFPTPKPFYVGELGEKFTGGDRSGFYRAEFTRWKNEGAFSVMPWQFDTSPFDVGVSDLYGVCRRIPEGFQHIDFDAVKGVISEFGADSAPIVVHIDVAPSPDEAETHPVDIAATAVNGDVTEPFSILRPMTWAFDILARFNDAANYAHAPDKLQRREGMLFVPREVTASLEVRAVQQGVVERIGYFDRGYGKFVLVRHEWNGDTYVSWYGHLEKVTVEQNQPLNAGDRIGLAGQTGSANEVCLFLTLQHIGKGLPNYVVDDVIDPEPLFRDTLPLPERHEAAGTADRFASPVIGAYTIGWDFHTVGHGGVDLRTGNEGNTVQAGGAGVVFKSKRCPKCTVDQPNFDSHHLSAEEREDAFENWEDWSWGFGHLVIVRYAWDDLPANAREVMRMGGFENWFAYVYYGHLKEISVSEGVPVAAGDELGKVGNTGNSTGPHLHVEIRVSPKATSDVANPHGGSFAERYRRIDPAVMFRL
jgi:murein DD-endopeptidase MepM/ murein hydrolase activator NlpD